MPVVTFFSDPEVEHMRSMPQDKEFDALLQDVRKMTGEDWIARRFGMIKKPRLFRKQEVWYDYQLYYPILGGAQWQIINLAVPGTSSGSVFGISEASRELTMNYLMGVLNGFDSCKRQDLGESLVQKLIEYIQLTTPSEIEVVNHGPPYSFKDGTLRIRMTHWIATKAELGVNEHLEVREHYVKFAGVKVKT